MKVIRARVLGYCMGVRRAIDSAVKALSLDNENGRVFTLGPLIHNPVALSALAEKGLLVLDEEHINCLKSSDTVIIRAHGVPPRLDKMLHEKACTVINSTCPRVTISQKRAADYVKQGYTVILAGDKNHGEVIGIAGYATEAGDSNHFILVQNKVEMEEAIYNKMVPVDKVVLLSQTTFSPSEFEAISSVLKAHVATVEIFNTICPATRERQEALQELAKDVDGIVVIGGKNSANTKRLFISAQKLSGNACYIETPDELPESFFKLEKVGITAGASTPDEVIEAVEKKLQGL